MNRTTIVLILVSFIVSTAIAYAFYFYNEKRSSRITWFLFVLRSLSLFFLGLLLINPTIETTTLEETKPQLSILIDNTNSIEFLNGTAQVGSVLQSIQNNKALQDKFSIHYYQFGNETQVLDSVDFNAAQSNISDALVQISKIQKDRLGAIILVSDGNQTLGNDYEYVSLKTPVYPIIVGDTTSFEDVSITRVNVNSYSYLNNKFPVEFFLNYEGSSSITTNVTIKHQSKTVYSKNISFSAANTSRILTTAFTSTTEGMNYYTLSVAPIQNEKNIVNNTKTFAVEVLKNETNILVLTSYIHPDLGALKQSIEQAEQRKVSIVPVNKFTGPLSDYQLVILYQPTSLFEPYLKELKSTAQNFWVISGSKTDWNTLNALNFGFQKKAISDTEEALATFNKDYLTFLQRDIGFSNFPPLTDVFGDIELNQNHQTLLYQNINSIETQQPLLTTLESGNQRIGVLFGEGFWKWRAASFVSTSSNESFDEFTANMVQYLASTKKKERLSADVKPLYPGNSTITINALYVDKNYQIDNRAELRLSLLHQETGEQQEIPFSFQGTSYEAVVSDIAPGLYTYTISVIGQNLTKKGQFNVAEFQVEQQFSRANTAKLQRLAENTSGQAYNPTAVGELSQQLVTDPQYTTLQEQIVKEEQLLDWVWILVSIVLLLTTEWFIRKYYGKI